MGTPKNRLKKRDGSFKYPQHMFWLRSFVFFGSCVSHAFASVHCCLVVTCWERADLLALVFPMWYPGSGVVLDLFASFLNVVEK